MLEFALWPLWKLLKPLLKDQLQGHFGAMAGELKGLLNSNLNDLEAAIRSHYAVREVTATVHRLNQPRDPDRIDLDVFPLESMKESKDIYRNLVHRLNADANTRMAVARNALGHGAAWDSFIESYATLLMQHAMPFVMRGLAKSDPPRHIALAKWVVDLAEKLPIVIDGKAGLHQTVVVVTKAGTPAQVKPVLKKVKSVWAKRNDRANELKIKPYDRPA